MSPPSITAMPISDVAIGRRMKGADTFIARRSAPGSTGSLPRRGFAAAR